MPHAKSELLELIRADLRARLDRLAKAARAAHEAATDPGSKAESKYDTRSLEESYLASGQARQFKELSGTLEVFENFGMRDFRADEEIASGALVGVKREGPGDEKMFFLMAPAFGGLEVVFREEEVTLLSPESPLYGKFFGKRAGELLEAPPFEIVSVE